jgi:hypothetical protein
VAARSYSDVQTGEEIDSTHHHLFHATSLAHAIFNICEAIIPRCYAKANNTCNQNIAKLIDLELAISSAGWQEIDGFPAIMRYALGLADGIKNKTSSKKG